VSELDVASCAPSAEVSSYAVFIRPGYSPGYNEPLSVERTRWDRDQWAVRWKGRCLRSDGQWEFEPIPSSRDDGFIRRSRFPLREALQRAQWAAEKMRQP
jgi:hypothetical protein